MDKLREKIEELKHAYARLSQREQFIVMATVAGVGLLVLLISGISVASSISKAEHRVKQKTEQLAKVLQLQGEYKTRKAEADAKLRQLGTNRNVRLVKVVEDVARQSGVEIGRLQPQDGAPNEEGVVESRVDMRAKGLSIDRLQDFLQRLERAQGLVIVNRLQIKKPYRKETLDVELSIVTYKVES